MKFDKWLDTFLSEKGIDLDKQLPVRRLDGTTGTMPVSFITEHMKVASLSEKQAIKHLIVKSILSTVTCWIISRILDRRFGPNMTNTSRWSNENT